MQVIYVHWRDACSEEGDGPLSENRLIDLHEVGYFGGEDEDSVTIVMEKEDYDNQPGRWRLHIPKVNIVEMRVADFDKAFPIKSPRKRKSKEKV